jgi:drug/metabolite transporter (DMT)-like permease
MSAERTSARNRQALLLGLLGVVIFGLTLPATRLAVADFDPLFVTAGRSLVAAALASLTLLWARSPPPLRREWLRLAAFAAFSIIGFPLLMAIAMQYAPASHGAVVLAVLPLLTAMGGRACGGRAAVPRVLGLWSGGNRRRARLFAAHRRRFRRSALG